jgi:hypothetical protein
MALVILGSWTLLSFMLAVPVGHALSRLDRATVSPASGAL